MENWEEYSKKMADSFEPDFENAMNRAYSEWKIYGKCSEAEFYNKNLDEKDKFDDAFPHFFTGDTKSEFVMVQLNPKRNKDGKSEDNNCYHKKVNEIYYRGEPVTIDCYDNYKKYFSEFGNRQYIKDKEYTSFFDKKQLLFLKSFSELFGFKEGEENLRENLAASIDKKLQLELVPFGSPDFSTNRILKNCDLSKTTERLLKFIASSERKYVIFCSRAFEKLLNEYNFIENQESEKFKLVKNDGTETKQKFEVIKIVLNVNGKKLNAVIAPQFALQSLSGNLRTQYGQKIKDAFRAMNK